MIPVSRTDIIIELGSRELESREKQRQEAIEKAKKDIDKITSRSIEMDQANRDLRQELADTTTKLSTMTQENKSLQSQRRFTRRVIRI